MVTCIGTLATSGCEPRQAWKGAAAAIDMCAGGLLVQVATLFVCCRHRIDVYCLFAGNAAGFQL